MYKNNPTHLTHWTGWMQGKEVPGKIVGFKWLEPDEQWYRAIVSNHLHRIGRAGCTEEQARRRFREQQRGSMANLPYKEDNRGYYHCMGVDNNLF